MLDRTRAAAPTAALGLFSLAVALTPAPSAAQSDSLEAVRREIQQMRAQYDALIEQMRRDYEARLQAIEARVKATETDAEAQKAALVAPAAAPSAPAPAPSSGNANAFNPAIGVVLDGKFTSYSRDPGSYRIRGFALGEEAGLDPRGFGLGESEINFSANIDQWLHGALTIAVERDGVVNVEEAFFQTTALPYGFTAKAGRLFSGIGYLNEQHAHVWDFADAPLPYRAFLNKQYGDDGAQLRWLAPTAFFFELGTEAFRGDAFPAGGAANRGIGAYSAFVHVGDDLGESHSFRGGLSWLHTKASNRETVSEFGTDIFSGHSDTGILDFVYKWAPGGNATETNFKLQGEYFVRQEDGTFNAIGYSGRQHGWYAQAVYQFMPRWRVGLRHDEVRAGSVSDALAGSALDRMGATPRRNSAMIDYNTSEFGRFRLQYNRDQSRPETDNQIVLQYTVGFGAHGAHSY